MSREIPRTLSHSPVLATSEFRTNPNRRRISWTRMRPRRLAGFHRHFYWELERYPLETEIPSPIPGAPPCLEWLLDHANPWLLKPGTLQHIVRVLTALKWRPSAIANLIFHYYNETISGILCGSLSILSRAPSFTRGCLPRHDHTGADRLIDLNCTVHRKRGIAWFPSVVPTCFVS